MQLAFKPSLTADDYLAGEQTSDTRHEFVNGQVFAMAGAGEWNAFYYPDVMVVCDGTDTQPYFKQKSFFLVDVLPPPTESTDRREKMLAYRTVPSLRDDLLISQDQRRVELYRRAADGTLATAVAVDAGNVAPECVQASLALDDIYENVKLVPNMTLALTELE